jgi:hypothetical protein
VPKIADLEALAAQLEAAQAPSQELDAAVAVVIGRPRVPVPPQWTAALDETLKLYQELLPGRPMQVTDDPENRRVFCTVKLYGAMPATPPYVVAHAATAPLAVLTAMVRTLIALEIDSWS